MSTPNEIWQHRISHEAEISYPLLEQGYLSIGFSDLLDTNLIQNIHTENGWQYLEQQMDKAWGHIPVSRYGLWRFLVDMQPGDWVLVPTRGHFSLYQIESAAFQVDQLDCPNLKNWHNDAVSSDGYLQCKKNGERHAYDIGYLLKVSLVEKDISRRDYADAALTSRMKYQRTNINCTGLRESINQALEAFRKGRPINLHSMILDASLDQTRTLIQEQLNPDKFEQLIQWYFQSQGASDVYIPSKNKSGKEGDGDIIATFEPLRTIYYIQAKHHKRVTGDWATQQISSYTDKKGKTPGTTATPVFHGSSPQPTHSVTALSN